MGKRKSKRKQVKKARATLDTQFTCLFCNHEKSLDVKLYVSFRSLVCIIQVITFAHGQSKRVGPIVARRLFAKAAL
jgi:transcription elongation factor Elf1